MMLQVHGVVDVQLLQTLQHALEEIVSVEGVRVDEELGRLGVSTALQILTKNGWRYTFACSIGTAYGLIVRHKLQ